VRALACILVLLGACSRSSSGELTTEQLTATVAREQPSLEPCYQDGLDRTPYEHEFRIESTLVIKPDGSVSKVKLDQNGLQGMGPCLEKVIRGWRFPTAKSSTHASLPLIFRPKVVESIPEGAIPPGFKVLGDPKLVPSK
jgi:hypothetical protein